MENLNDNKMLMNFQKCLFSSETLYQVSFKWMNHHVFIKFDKHFTCENPH